MVVNPFRAFLFLAGVGVAALGTAYVAGAFDPWFAEAPAPVASLPQPVEHGVDAKGERLPGAKAVPGAAATKPMGGEKSAEGETSEKPKAETSASGSPVVPGFDVVRVEPNGSVVIAGTAAPDSTVEVIADGKAVGSAKADAGGDFAIVFDKPLAPGDYQLTLRATPSGGEAVASDQSATVSVPKAADGQVLAMIETPGKPSEVVTAPNPATAETAPAQTMPAEAKPAETAADAKAASPSSDAADAAKQSVAPGPVDEPAAVAAAQPQPTETAPAEPKAAEAAPAQPSSAEAKPAAPASAATVSVQAVEIEGSKIFVAGMAEPGRTVRVYANEMLLGEAKTAPNGRFLVEAERELPVGSYMIRADVLGKGAEVAARAVVPFEREPGEAIAAVAPEASQPATQAPAASASASEPSAGKPAAGTSTETAAAQTEPGKEGTGTTPATDAADSAAPATAEKSAGASIVVTVAPTQSSSAPAGDVKLPELGTTIASNPPEVTAAKLQPVQNAVIIRRGDSLWRISRRVYGRGIRYSTIYMANQEQIRDPDLIWPGQVFSVPDKTTEGESADMKAIGEQATSQ